MRRPFKITAYGYAKDFSRGDRFKLDPFDGHPREARGSALKARADLLALMQNSEPYHFRFIPCHFLRAPRISVPDLELADRATLKIQNGRYKTQNTRDIHRKK